MKHITYAEQIYNETYNYVQSLYKHISQTSWLSTQIYQILDMCVRVWMCVVGNGDVRERASIITKTQFTDVIQVLLSNYQHKQTCTLPRLLS